MARLVLLGVVVLLLVLACGQSQRPPPPPTRVRVAPTIPALAPTATFYPTPTPRLRATLAPAPILAEPAASPPPKSIPALPPAPGPLPTATPAPQSQEEARNLAWAYLSQCVTFDPSQLNAYRVKEDWYVKTSANSSLQLGIWRVVAATDELKPHDLLARQWQRYIETKCSLEIGATLFPSTPTPTIGPAATATPTPGPTITPTPAPTATPVVPRTTDAIASLWAYLVKCFPSAKVTDFEAVLDPVSDQYVVKDKLEIQYGVWRVSRVTGAVRPDNDWARRREQTVRGGTC